MRALFSVVFLISGSFCVAAAHGILQGLCHEALDTSALCTDIGDFDNCGWCFKWDFPHPEGFACTCDSDHPRAEEFGGCYPTACQNGWECDQPEQWEVDEDELDCACDAMPATICELTPNNTVCCGVPGIQAQYDNNCWASQGYGIEYPADTGCTSRPCGEVSGSGEEEECLCTRELDPQCCLFETFDNPCLAKCKYGEDGFEAVCEAGPCPECGCEEEDVQPVCCDGSEFPNLCTAECHLGEANATEVCVPGQCEPEPEPGCACTLDLQPVCCDGQEFANQCGAECELGEETARDICRDGPCGMEELFPGQCPIDFNPVCCTPKMQLDSTENEEQQLTSEPITEFQNLCEALKAGMEMRFCQPGSCKEVGSRPSNCQLGHAVCSMNHCAFVRCPDMMPNCIQNDCLEYKIFGRVEVGSCEATCVTAEDLAAEEECGGNFTLCLTLAEREEECTALNCAPGTSCTINPCAAPISDQAGNMVDSCGVYCKPNDG